MKIWTENFSLHRAWTCPHSEDKFMWLHTRLQAKSSWQVRLQFLDCFNYRYQLGIKSLLILYFLKWQGLLLFLQQNAKVAIKQKIAHLQHEVDWGKQVTSNTLQGSVGHIIWKGFLTSFSASKNCDSPFFFLVTSLLK